MLAKEAAFNHILEHFASQPHAYLSTQKTPQLSLRIKAPSIDYAVCSLNVNLLQRFITVCPSDNMFRVSSWCQRGWPASFPGLDLLVLLCHVYGRRSAPTDAYTWHGCCSTCWTSWPLL